MELTLLESGSVLLNCDKVIMIMIMIIDKVKSFLLISSLADSKMLLHETEIGHRNEISKLRRIRTLQ
jgi:hypothetical protein